MFPIRGLGLFFALIPTILEAINPIISTDERHRIRRTVQEDGLGAIYEADDLSDESRVYLRKIRLGVASDSAAARVAISQLQTLTALRLPGVMPVLHAGFCDGELVYSMPATLGATLAKNRRSVGKVYKRTASIVAEIAQALHAAHQHGILHGGLTPGSVFITDKQKPLVMDFGLSRLADREAQPADLEAYAAPECLIDKRPTVAVDVYAVGTLLYEMLVGHPPFRGTRDDGILLEKQKLLPESPRAFDPGIPEGLSAICMHCLGVEPTDRYASCDQITSDLENWRTRGPISLDAASLRKVLGQWAHLRPIRGALLGLVTAIFVIAAIYSSVQLIVSRRNTIRLEKTAGELRDNLWHSSVALARQTQQSNAAGRITQALEAVRRAAGFKITAEVRTEAVAALSTADLLVAKTWTTRPPGSVLPVLFSPDMRLTFRATLEGGFQIVDTATAKILGEIRGPKSDPVTATSPLMSYGHLFATRSVSGTIRVWESVAPGAMLFEFPNEPVPAADPWSGINFAVNPAGILMVGQADGRVGVFNPILRGNPTYFSSGKKITRIEFNPTGNRLAIVREGSNTLEIVFPEKPETPAIVLSASSQITVVGWSLDARLIAAASEDGVISVWRLRDQRLISRFRGSASPTQLLFTNKGTHLLSTSKDVTIRLWNISGGFEEAVLTGYGNEPVLRLSDDDQRLFATDAASQAVEIRLRVPAICHPIAAVPINQPLGTSGVVDFSQDSALFCLATPEMLQFRETATGNFLATIGKAHVTGDEPVPDWSMAFARFGETLYTNSRDGGLEKRYYEWKDESLTFAKPENILKLRNHAISGISPDGNLLGLASEELNQTQILNLPTLKVRPGAAHENARDLNINPTSDKAAVSGAIESKTQSGRQSTRNPKVFDLLGGDVLSEIDVGPGGNTAWSANGVWLAVSGNRGLRLVQSSSWSPGPTLTPEAAAGGKFPAWSPDGKLFAVTVGNRVELYSVPEFDHVMDLALPMQPLNSPRLRFSRDSRHLVLASERGELQIWHLTLLRSALRDENLDW